MPRLSPLAYKVAAAYRLIRAMDESLWDGAVAALQDFQVEAEKLRDFDITTQEGMETLRQARFSNKSVNKLVGGLGKDQGFVEWMKVALPNHKDWERSLYGYMRAVAEGANKLFEAEGLGDRSTVLRPLETYEKVVSDLVSKVAPARLTYDGFAVDNPDRLLEPTVRALLGGVDYVLALFKKRGLEEMLRDGLRGGIGLYGRPPEGSDAAGHYFSTKGRIQLYAVHMIGASGGKLMQDWIAEVFLHEFGHHVHLSVMPKDAMEAWNGTWDEVKSEKKKLEETLQSITGPERMRYWNLLEAAGYQPNKAAAKMKPIDKLKFGVWLRNPRINGPLITPAQFRLSKEGQEYFSFFLDPEKYLREERFTTKEQDGEKAYEDLFNRVQRQRYSRLGLLDAGNDPLPIAMAEELMKADPSLQKAVDAALDKLQPVTEYAKTNEKEDFAEAFVAFVAAPEKLTPSAKFRMQRALSLAGLYGKSLGRVSSKKPDIDPA
jgi:hypothetical protein